MTERKASPLVHSVSALSAGVIATACTHPLDLVKARFQVQHVQKGKAELQYKSVGQAFRLIVAQEGLSGLYRGLAPNIIGNGVSWGLYMFWYQSLKNLSGDESPSSLHALALAGAAGAATSLMTNPIWLIKVRLQSQPFDAPDRYLGVAHCMRTIYREEGLSGFWRGIVPALFGVSHGAVQMATYEGLRQRLWKSVDLVQPYHYLGLGIVSKSVASLVTFPYQLVKTRMQVRDAHFHREQSFLKTVSSVWKNEGIRVKEN